MDGIVFRLYELSPVLTLLIIIIAWLYIRLNKLERAVYRIEGYMKAMDNRRHKAVDTSLTSVETARE